MHKLIGPVLHAFGLSCRRFNELASLRLDVPLTFKERISFTLHRMVCSICRPMPRQLARLRAWMLATDQADQDNPAPLPQEVTTRIRDALDKAKVSE